MISRLNQTAIELPRRMQPDGVRKDGDNYVLENDKDKQRYRIQNSEAVRANEGHHVKVNGRLNEDDRSLEVCNVKRLKEQQQRHNY